MTDTFVIQENNTTIISIESTPPTIISQIERGVQGVQGKSAYQSALDNGFVGTESEWIISLSGSLDAISAIVDSVFVLSKHLTGIIQGNGLLVETDSILQAFQKINDINSTISITKNLLLIKDWIDVGISGNDLASGSYAIQIFANDIGSGGLNNNEYCTGIMSWYSDTTRSLLDLPSDEIILHRAGGGDDKVLFLRTYRENLGHLKLQIYSTIENSSSANYSFKFKKLI